MNNSWTGGQYSVFRIILGMYLLMHFTYLIPWGEEVFSSNGMLANASSSPLIYFFPNILAIFDAPLFVIGLLMLAAIASIFFMIGCKDRLAAFFIWYVLACLFGRNPLIANPSLPYVGWMLLAHIFVTKAPFGSWSARGRANPSGGWFMPENIFTAAWIVLAVSYSYSGYTKLLSPSWLAGQNIQYVLNNPLARDYFLREFLLWLPPIFLQLLTWTVLYVELLFAPLALIGKLRPWLWGLMFGIQCGFAFLLNFPDLTFAMLIFHLFTFNPSWIKPKQNSGKEILFYDGNCGLCHRTIRFLLAEDTKEIFRFSPLQGQMFKTILPDTIRQSLPDSIVLLHANNQIVTKSSAVIYLLSSLGGLWKVFAGILWLIPKVIRDWGYDRIGKIRLTLFKTPVDTCPLIPPSLRHRFL